MHTFPEKQMAIDNAQLDEEIVWFYTLCNSVAQFNSFNDCSLLCEFHKSARQELPGLQGQSGLGTQSDL